MSIRTFNKLLNPGCVGGISVVLLLTMAAGFLFQGGRGAAQQTEDPSAPKPVVIGKVGDFQIDENAIDAAYSTFSQRMASLDPPTPEQDLLSYGQAVIGQVQAGIVLIEAKRKNISITDQDILKFNSESIDRELMTEKLQMSQAGQLPPTATDAQFLEAFKKMVSDPKVSSQLQSVKTMNDLKKVFQTEFQAQLANPATRLKAASQAATQLIPTTLAGRLNPSDADLKASYVTISAKRVLFSGADSATDLDKAQTDLKKGASFETVVDRYSKDTGTAGKRPSQTPISIVRDDLIKGELSALLKLKVGEVSGPLNVPEGTAIYKIEAIKPELPKDFEKRKDALKRAYANVLAEAEFNGDIKTLMKSDVVTWSVVGWKALYEYSLLQADTSIGISDKTAKLQTIAKEAQGGLGDALGKKPAALTFYQATQDLSHMLTGAQKDALADSEIAAITAVSEFNTSSDLSLKLTDLYAQKKDSANVAQWLNKAASDNVSFTSLGLRNYNSINSDEAKYKASGILTADAAKSIDATQAKWKSDKADQDKQMAQAAAAQAADKAKQEADMKKFEAEKKAEEEKAKNATPIDRSKIGSLNTPAGTGAKSGAPTPPGQVPGQPPISLDPGIPKH